MPTDTPPHPFSPPHRTTTSAPSQRSPRVLAALAYAVPLVPALVLLVRERHNRFVRHHAAQALIFFLLVALAQSALFVALVVLGGIVEALPVAVAFGLLFYALFAIVGIISFIVWLRLLSDAICGRQTTYFVLSSGADRLESTAARLAARASTFSLSSKNAPT